MAISWIRSLPSACSSFNGASAATSGRTKSLLCAVARKSCKFPQGAGVSRSVLLQQHRLHTHRELRRHAGPERPRSCTHTQTPIHVGTHTHTDAYIHGHTHTQTMSETRARTHKHTHVRTQRPWLHAALLTSNTGSFSLSLSLSLTRMTAQQNMILFPVIVNLDNAGIVCYSQ